MGEKLIIFPLKHHLERTRMNKNSFLRAIVPNYLLLPAIIKDVRASSYALKRETLIWENATAYSLISSNLLHNKSIHTYFLYAEHVTQRCNMSGTSLLSDSDCPY